MTTTMLHIIEEYRRIRGCLYHLVGWNVYFNGSFMEQIKVEDAPTKERAEEIASKKIEEYQLELS